MITKTLESNATSLADCKAQGYDDFIFILFLSLYAASMSCEACT